MEAVVPLVLAASWCGGDFRRKSYGEWWLELLPPLPLLVLVLPLFTSGVLVLPVAAAVAAGAAAVELVELEDAPVAVELLDVLPAPGML